MHTPHRLAFVSLTLSLLGAGCVQDTSCDTCTSGAIYESEINDTALQANWIGAIYPGEQLLIDGHITQWGPDLFDGFALQTGASMQVEVWLWADNPQADLDLCVWDPVFGQFVACFETSAKPEGGSFVILEAGKDFHLVVRSYAGNSSYRLEVLGLGPVYGAGAAPSAGQLSLETDQAWEAYAGGRDAPLAGREPAEAVLLEFDAQGELLGAHAARVVDL